MNLKKIGSALTAISMVASMATYVPFAASAADVTSFSGTLTNCPAVSYTVDYSSDPVLTIAPKTAGTTYTVPDQLIYELAYTLVSTTDTEQKKYDTVNEAAAAIKEIVIVGAAKISDEAFNLPDTDVDSSSVTATLAANADGKISIDCQATYESPAGTFSDIAFASGDVVSTSIAGIDNGNARIAHTMIANNEKQNHKCLYGDKVDASFTAHRFTAADGATVGNGAHICKCGKSSEDYKTTAADKQTSPFWGYLYSNIHNWDTDKHVCKDCGVDMTAAHEPVYTKVDSTTHKTVCNTCKKTLATTEAHNFQITGLDMGKDVGKKCAAVGCDAKHSDTEHVYEYAWSYNEDGVAEFNKVGTATGLVCACGKIKTHTTHNYVKANGHHLCACGVEYNHDDDKDFTQKYNANGVLVAVAADEGVICPDCGAIKTHVCQSGDTATFYDTTEHVHYCYCGQAIESPTHTAKTDKTNNKHVCQYCLAENVVPHNYNRVLVTYSYTPADGTSKTEFDEAVKTAKKNSQLLTEAVALTANTNISGFTDDGKSAGGNAAQYDETNDSLDYQKTYICECGAVEPHTHNYIYGVNQEHYCACGAKQATANHNSNYETLNGDQVCAICGNIKNHTHTFDYTKDCKCTNPNCDVTDHDFEVVGTKHICQNCGEIGNDALDSTHTYVIDKENHKHVCACGKEKTHVSSDYVNHVCECGATNHTKSNDTKTVNGKKVHYCTAKLDDGTTACTYVYTADEDYGHTYAVSGDDKCTICHELNDNHVHAVATSGDSAADTCRCGATIDHVWGLAASDFVAKHQCTNYEYTVDANGKLSNSGTRCSKTSAHDWEDTDANNKTVTLDFCADCGAMNPATLVDADVLTFSTPSTYKLALNFTNPTPGAAEPAYLPNMYRTSYLVELKQAYNAVLAYDITGNGESDPTKITLAATEAAQAKALEAVETFETVWAKNADYQAASSARIGYVIEKNGTTTVDHSTRGTAVYSDGTANAAGAVYGKVGETVTIQVKPNAGYKFVGWYATQTPSATDTPICTTAAFDVEIKDGHFTYYAKFAENERKTITFNKGIKYYSSITAPKLGDNWTTGTEGFPATLSFLANEEVIVKADSTQFSGDAVAGITDKYGNIVEYNFDSDEDGTPDSYKFTVTYDNTFSVSTYATTPGGTKCYAQFMVGGKIVAARLLPTHDVTSIAPDDPEKTGYEFKGWYLNGDTSRTVEKLKTVSFDAGVLVPRFDKIANLTFSVKNGSIDKDSVKDAYEYGDQVLITAALQDANGKYFSGWFDENGNLVSQERTTKINITKSMVLTAKYTRDTELVIESGVTLAYNRTSTAIELTATRRLTDDMTLVEIGMLYKVGEVAEADLKIENEQLGRKYKSDVEKKNGDYVVTLNLSSEAAKTSTISAISYFIYQDAEGVNHTVYSNAVYAEPVQ